MFGLFIATENKFVPGAKFVYLKETHATLELAREAAKASKVRNKELHIAKLEWLSLQEEPKFEGNVVAFRKRA